MHKTLTAVLLALTLPTLAMAMPEEGGKYAGHKGAHGHHLYKELDLTKEQRQEMRKLMREQMQSRHQITKRYLEKLPAAEQQAMQDELTAARSAHQKSMRDMLKPEQQAAFDEHLKKMQAHRAEKASQGN